MVKFKFSKRKLSHIPFPSLVSVILYYYRIWYVGTVDTLEYPPFFGKTMLNLMKIRLEEEESGQSRAPTRSQTRASHSEAHEAQSAPPPPQPSLPADLTSQIKEIIDAALASMTMRMEFELGKLRAEVASGQNGLVEIQDAMKEHLEAISGQSAEIKEKAEEIDAKLSTQMVSHLDLTDKVDKIIQHLHIGPSTSDSTPRASSPTFSFPSPQIPTSSPEPSTPIISSPTTAATPATVVLPDVAGSPSTPATVILPSPIPSPPFEDDKGGEKSEEQL